MSLIVLRFGLVGCQNRPAHYPTREALDGGFGNATVSLGAEDCPGLSFTATPAEARIGQPISVVAVGANVDSDASSDAGDGITYAWTASNGYFQDPTAASTSYVCPGRDHAGPQTITISASLGSCVTSRSVTVLCIAFADGGGPATVGPPPGADAGVNCVRGDPTKCEGDPCNKCTDDNCDTLATAAAQGTVPTSGCDIFVTDDEMARCKRLYACMRDSACVANSDPTRCWCGSVDTYECETGMTPPAGPCVKEFNDAAGSTDAVVINNRLTDPNFPLGGAINLAACRSVSCSQLGDPPNPVCSL